MGWICDVCGEATDKDLCPRCANTRPHETPVRGPLYWSHVFFQGHPNSSIFRWSWQFYLFVAMICATLLIISLEFWPVVLLIGLGFVPRLVQYCQVVAARVRRGFR